MVIHSKAFTLSFVLLLGIGVHGSSQSYLSGYVITLTGDTLTGSIKKAFPNEMANFITFRTDGTATERIYTAQQLSGYSLQDGGTYESHPIQMLPDADTVSYFVKCIVGGAHRVYSLHQDFLTSSDTPLENRSRPGTDPVTDIPILRGDVIARLPENRRNVWYFVSIPAQEAPILLFPQRFAEILVGVIGPCDSIKISSYSYTDYDIARLTMGLSECQGEVTYSYVDLVKPTNKVIFKAGVGAQYNWVTSGVPVFQTLDFSPAIGSIIAVYLEFPLSSRLSAQLGLQYSRYTVTHDSLHIVPSNFTNAGEEIPLEQSMRFSLLTLPTYLKYQLGTAEQVPYLFAGATISRVLNRSFLQTIQNRTGEGGGGLPTRRCGRGVRPQIRHRYPNSNRWASGYRTAIFSWPTTLVRGSFLWHG